MPRNNKKHFVTLGGLVLAATIVLPVLFGAPRQIEGQKGGDPWRNIIFDFQTLLTGLLAVGAASWTVMTMERTDMEAERRHRELVKMNLRADRLRVERMLYPAMSELRGRYREMADVDFDVLESMVESGEGSISETMHRMIRVQHEVRAIVRSAIFVAARDLFDGHLNAQDDDLTELSNAYWKAADACYDACVGLRKAIQLDDDWLTQRARRNVLELLSDAREAHARFMANFNALLRSLEKMRREYEIHSITP